MGIANEFKKLRLKMENQNNTQLHGEIKIEGQNGEWWTIGQEDNYGNFYITSTKGYSSEDRPSPSLIHALKRVNKFINS